MKTLIAYNEYLTPFVPREAENFAVFVDNAEKIDKWGNFKMLILNTEDLGIPKATQLLQLQFSFLGRNFVIRELFPPQARKSVLQRCRGYLESGKFCLVIEGAAQMGLCFETSRLNPSETATPNPSTNTQSPPMPPQPESEQPPSELKYRGIPVQPSVSRATPLIKDGSQLRYRGTRYNTKVTKSD